MNHREKQLKKLTSSLTTDILQVMTGFHCTLITTHGFTSDEASKLCFNSQLRAICAVMGAEEKATSLDDTSPLTQELLIHVTETWDQIYGD